MPYRNIVFAKLEKRLQNDPRWYMMSEEAQLNYIKLILFACETYNKIPKISLALKRAFKTDQSLETIESTIKEIKKNFIKFRENKYFYYFKDFNEKTNYIPIRELQRKSQVLPKEATDKEEEEDKELDKELDKEEDKDKEKNYKKVALDFLSYFNLKTEKKYTLTDERKRIIKSRLKEGYTLEQLKQAVDNFIKDDWQDRPKFTDVIYCIGVRNKIDNLEKWLNWKERKQFGVI